jgi:hypothetical protein
MRPAGPLTLYHQAAGEDPVSVAFTPLDEEGRRDPQKRVTTYPFIREGGAAVFYRPGDSLWAELPVRKDGEAGEWLLTWARGRSEVYQFERLVRPPRLHRKGEKNTAGDLLEDVSLAVTPEGGIAPVPDLMPVVNLKKQ